jgi:hypothetical protein
MQPMAGRLFGVLDHGERMSSLARKVNGVLVILYVSFGKDEKLKGFDYAVKLRP